MPHFQISNSLSLFYTLSGDASYPPILLLHGWCADSHDWSWQIPFLESNHHVITMDLRGHGRSSAPEDIKYRPQAFAEDAVALLKHLNIPTPLIIMGHSMGGVTASVFAAMYPELVKAIALVDPPYWNPSAVCDYMVPSRQNFPDTHSWALNTYMTLAPDNVPAWMRTWYHRRVEGTPAHVVFACIDGMYGEGAIGRAELHTELVKEKRRCPRFVTYVSEERVEKERQFGMGEFDIVVPIKGVGHWFHQVKSEEFNALLGEWLNKLEKA
ncbi:Alpha/Beta hydrolase protein [Lophiotrema nucula]|uniref:Alpha/Beta hydrolase protein n=1 Tax=Lophiotrema nucula TaxID=690887 RepID=A0A6A5ZBP6_9PLEO|nr:Alpha/Beta hydrolase protein [Lophiotrema nucula]